MKDVIIVGGGIIGLSCAWHLQEAGMQVVVVDKGDFTDGCSFGNAGMIVPSHFTPLASPGMLKEGIQWMFKSKSPFYIKPRLNAELVSWLWQFLRSSNAKHVEACAPVLKDLHEESKSIYSQWSQLPGFSFDLQEKGIMMLYQTAKAEQDEIETAEKAHALGMRAEMLNSKQAAELERNVKLTVRGGVLYPGDATFSPDVFMKQMIEHLQKIGVGFISNVEVVGVHEIKNRGVEIFSKDGQRWNAKYVVLATGASTRQIPKSINFKLPMQGGKGYSMTFENHQPMPSYPSLLHEARVSLTPMRNRLRIGGTLEISGRDNRIREAKIKWITEAIPKYYPELNLPQPEKIWFGYRPCTPDGMPVIGRLNEHPSIFLATGHSMMGVSLAPATGRIVRDILIGNHAVNKLLSPTRF
jgi:D-amino-acid dehydrogenase